LRIADRLEGVDWPPGIRKGIHMSLHRLTAAIVIVFVSTTLDARADNSVSVLQFGTANLSSTTQTGTTTNGAITLQFGSSNQASSVQSGSISPLTVNTLVIGQGGSTNVAAAGQVGGSNTSLIGQIGASNSSAVSQLGLLNGSTILQASP